MTFTTDTNFPPQKSPSSSAKINAETKFVKQELEKIEEMKFKFSVNDLRKMGYDVKVHHSRYCQDMLVTYADAEPCNFNPRGGLTQVEITTPDGSVLSGESRCSKEDPFNKKLGVRIAIGRALKGVN